MKSVGMLALVLVAVWSTIGFGQEELPLEPIPLPAPVAKADNVEGTNSQGTVEPAAHEEVAMPLDGPVFPDGSSIVEEPPLEPMALETTVIESPAEPYPSAPPRAMQMAPPANGNQVVREGIVNGPAVSRTPPQAVRRAPTTSSYAAPGRALTYGQTYYRSGFQPGRRRVYQQSSYQQVVPYPPNTGPYPPNTGPYPPNTGPYPSNAGVAVYRMGPGGVRVMQVAPANYAVEVRVPARAVRPFTAYRTGYAPAYAPVVAVDPGLYPVPVAPFVPGQPVRNAIRAMMW